MFDLFSKPKSLQEKMDARVRGRKTVNDLIKQLPEQEMGINHRIVVNNVKKMMASNNFDKASKYLKNQLSKMGK